MKKNHALLRGFTIIELLIAMAIAGIVAGIILFNYHNYGETSYLKSASNGIALAFRQAQVDSTNGREFTPGTKNVPLYGVEAVAGSGAPYIIYGDLNKDKIYTKNATPRETVLSQSVTSGYTITLCGETKPNTSYACNLTAINALFDQQTYSVALTDNKGNSYYSIEVMVTREGHTSPAGIVTLWSNGLIQDTIK